MKELLSDPAKSIKPEADWPEVLPKARIHAEDGEWNKPRLSGNDGLQPAKLKEGMLVRVNPSIKNSKGNLLRLMQGMSAISNIEYDDERRMLVRTASSASVYINKLMQCNAACNETQIHVNIVEALVTEKAEAGQPGGFGDT